MINRIIHTDNVLVTTLTILIPPASLGAHPRPKMQKKLCKDNTGQLNELSDQDT